MISWDSAFRKQLTPEFSEALTSVFGRRIAGIRQNYLIDESGGHIPVVGQVARFVETDVYARSFSFQWQRFNSTQLDSLQNSTLTQQDLVSKLQLKPEDFRGKLVLDVGVGVGRHAEYFCRAGAFVVAVDLSESVTEAAINLQRHPNAVVLQADLFALPFELHSFDLVYSVGVLHHTPSWRGALDAIAKFVRSPGGAISVWIYGPAFRRREEWIPYTSEIEPELFLDICRFLARAHRRRRGRISTSPDLARVIEVHMPFSVHHENLERSVLALFDGYSPKYHATSTSMEVAQELSKLGFYSKAGPVDASGLGLKLPQVPAVTLPGTGNS